MSSLFADTHNVVAILEKSDTAEGFEQIIDFLSGSYIHYALIVNPNIYISCIKQFWNTASVKRSDDVTRLQALVDRKKIMISEAVIRKILQLDDDEGVSLSAKRTSWNEFSTAMASAVICLSKGQKFNFSKYIFDSLVRNVDSSSKFYMYPRFIQLIIQNQVGDLSTHTTRFISPALTQKVFVNMRRVRKGFSGVETPLFEEQSSPPQQPQSSPQAPPQGAEFPTHIQQVLDVCYALTRYVENLEHDKAAQKLEIITLKARVKRLERANKVKSSKLRRLRKVGASKRIESSNDMEDVFNQGRMIDDLDKDEGIELVKDADIAEIKGRHVAKQAEKQAEIYHLDLDHSSIVLNVVTAASQVIAASATISAAKPSILAVASTVVVAYTRRRKGVIIRDLEEELSSKTPAETPKLKDKGKEINKDIDWDTAIDHVNQKSKNPQYIKRYQGMKKRPQTEIDDEDDDVFIEANPLARKVPVVDYHIVLVDNKPRFKIIKADETHQLYISFITLLKNFDREDLENLLGIVKKRFSTSKPTNFFDEYLLLTLKTMFEKPDRQDAVWKSQRSVHGLALVKSWKLLTSCGVHIITLSTIQLILLVKRRYPLSRFTLEQLVNVTTLQVEEESKMSLELLRFTRQQLQEYQQR
uniref:Xylulose kinase-1 n=1 Tax=Tanacetum cinerariifolium TaxID=118510 RepID=A0A6L2LYJ9_TANCI|nr:hypothetical protein [Tanacetum cinerariifolium]